MKKIIIVVLLIFTTLWCYAPNLSLSDQIEYSKQSDTYYQLRLKLEHINQLEHSEFSYNNLVTYMDLLKIEEIEVVIRQAVLESGWFKSDLFVHHNNLFGMKKPQIRPTTAIGRALGHAKFRHWTDSVKDYVLWQNYFKTIMSIDNIDNYYAFLSHVGYAENGKYVALLKSINLEKLQSGNRIANRNCTS